MVTGLMIFMTFMFFLWECTLGSIATWLTNKDIKKTREEVIVENPKEYVWMRKADGELFILDFHTDRISVTDIVEQFECLGEL